MAHASITTRPFPRGTGHHTSPAAALRWRGTRYCTTATHARRTATAAATATWAKQSRDTGALWGKGGDARRGGGGGEGAGPAAHAPSHARAKSTKEKQSPTSLRRGEGICSRAPVFI